MAAIQEDLRTLERDFGLPLPPPGRLQVKKQKKYGGEGLFRFCIEEPGWSAESLQGNLSLGVDRGPGTTDLFWWLHCSEGTQGSWSVSTIPLHLWRGDEHRFLMLEPSAAGSGPKETLGMVLGAPFAVAFSPIWLPVYLGQEARERKMEERSQAARIRPGPTAPPVVPATASGSIEWALDQSNGLVLSIRLPESLWPPTCGSSDLQAVQQAIGTFQPNLVEAVRRHPDRAGVYLVRLLGHDAGKPGTVLFCWQGRPPSASMELWAIYFPAGAAWVKAWRLVPVH